MDSLEERNIILLGKLGAGKSHSGNGILGLQNYFKSMKGWQSGTRKCECGSAFRNGRTYRVFDTPGINSMKDISTTVDVETEIRRCLFHTSPGFHAIVLVLSADERLTAEDVKMVETLDDMLGKKGFGYMMLVVTKMDENYANLNNMIDNAKEIKKLDEKCQKRRVIFGKNDREIPRSCLMKFDEELEKLVLKNRKNGEEYFKHDYYKRASKILERDKAEYLRKNPHVTAYVASETVRVTASEVSSPQYKELSEATKGGCCVIS